MSGKTLRTVAMVALFVGIGKTLRGKRYKMTNGPRGRRHPHGPHFFRHGPFRHWKGSFECDAEGPEANTAEAII